MFMLPELHNLNLGPAVRRIARYVSILFLLVMMASPEFALGQRRVDFPPAESEPPPRHRSPPRTQAGGEDTGLISDFGAIMRKTQERTPPPPTNLTVMYKLQYGEELEYIHPDGRRQTFEQWRSFPDDGDQLIRHTNRRLDNGMNYQYATKALAAEDGFDPVDIPLLFMAGDYDFVFTEAEVENLRQFLVDGGTILFNAARGREEFVRAAVREMQRVFPDKTFMRLPLDHPMYNARYRINQVLTMANGVQFTQDPEAYSIDIGTRAAAIMVPWGMGAAWSDEDYHAGGRHLIGDSAIRMGVNIVAYVLGSTEYGRFLAQEFPLYRGATRPGDTFRFVLARYSGSWNVNPSVQNPLLRTFYDNTGIGVDYAPYAVDLADPAIGRFPFLFMTGHYDFELTEDERENLRDYLGRGGFILASSAAGLKPFDIAFRRELERAFPDRELVPIPPSHPVFTRGWVTLDRIEYTPAALQDDPLLEYPEFEGLFIDGRLAVLYSPYDLLSGINRESNAYAKGVETEDAIRLVINIITYAMSH